MIDKLINRNFNRWNTLNKIVYENMDNIAYELANKFSNSGIYNNFDKVLSYNFLPTGKKNFGFTLRQLKSSNKKDFKSIKQLGMTLDLSFLAPDFIGFFGRATYPVCFYVEPHEMYVDYHFIVPYLDLNTDAFIKENNLI